MITGILEENVIERKEGCDMAYPYTCDSCKGDSSTLISHPKVNGVDSFCPDCFYAMVKTLTELKKYCPVCLVEYGGHDQGCLQRTLQISERADMAMTEVYA